MEKFKSIRTWHNAVRNVNKEFREETKVLVSSRAFCGKSVFKTPASSFSLGYSKLDNRKTWEPNRIESLLCGYSSCFRLASRSTVNCISNERHFGLASKKNLPILSGELSKSTQEKLKELEGESNEEDHPLEIENNDPPPPARENIFTVPNILCFTRIGMAPAICYYIVSSNFYPAIALLSVGGVTDLLDGWIARLYPSQRTVMGSFLDPMADKILVGTLFLSLSYIDLIPMALTGIIVGRDLGLIAAGFYIRFQSLDPPKTFTRYFNVTLPTAQLTPTFISKVNTGVQLSLVGLTLLSAVMPDYDFTSFLFASWCITASTTILSALSYVFAKDSVKFLKIRGQRIMKSKVNQSRRTNTNSSL